MHEIKKLMHQLGVQARNTSRVVALASPAEKQAAIERAAEFLKKSQREILAANKQDISAGEKAGLSKSMLDRLRLDASRLTGIAESLLEIANLPDPVGEVIAKFERPNGLSIERVRTPMGVIGVIFESRPNVTADAGALCLKSGNAVILRGGSDSFQSSRAIHACLSQGLAAAGLPTTSIQLVPTTDRAAVGEMLQGLDGNIDVVVPRGGRRLVERVQAESRVPVFSHLEGICHVFVHRSAKLAMANEIVLNAKMRRTGICGAAETLLIDRACVETHLLPILDTLQAAGCEIRGDQETCAQVANCRTATESDWSTEYLDAILSVKIVDGIDEAIRHIGEYSSHHTEAIVAEDQAVADRFLREIDSAILLHNASTQFADGGEFGMGAEIGIATGKMHARGPVGVEQLTSFNYRVHGQGQIRQP